MNGMRTGEKLGMEPAEHPETVIVDYGGANVAKPLHVAISVPLSSVKPLSAWAVLWAIR